MTAKQSLKGRGQHGQRVREYAKIQLLMIDDWGLIPPHTDGRHDLLETLDDRHNRRSTVITSQLPVAAWHEYLNDPTVADTISHRPVNRAIAR